MMDSLCCAQTACMDRLEKRLQRLLPRRWRKVRTPPAEEHVVEELQKMVVVKNLQTMAAAEAARDVSALPEAGMSPVSTSSYAAEILPETISSARDTVPSVTETLLIVGTSPRTKSPQLAGSLAVATASRPSTLNFSKGKYASEKASRPPSEAPPPPEQISNGLLRENRNSLRRKREETWHGPQDDHSLPFIDCDVANEQDLPSDLAPLATSSSVASSLPQLTRTGPELGSRESGYLSALSLSPVSCERLTSGALRRAKIRQTSQETLVARSEGYPSPPPTLGAIDKRKAVSQLLPFEDGVEQFMRGWVYKTKYVTTVFEAKDGGLGDLVEDATEEINRWLERRRMLVAATEVHFSVPQEKRSRKDEQRLKTSLLSSLVKNNQRILNLRRGRRLAPIQLVESWTEEKIDRENGCIQGVYLKAYGRLLRYSHWETPEWHSPYWKLPAGTTRPRPRQFIWPAESESLEKTALVAVNLLALTAVHIRSGAEADRLLRIQYNLNTRSKPFFPKGAALYFPFRRGKSLGRVQATAEDSGEIFYYLIPSCSPQTAIFSLNSTTGELAYTGTEDLKVSRVELCVLASKEVLTEVASLVFDKESLQNTRAVVVTEHEEKILPDLRYLNNTVITLDRKMSRMRMDVGDEERLGSYNFSLSSVFFLPSETVLPLTTAAPLASLFFVSPHGLARPTANFSVQPPGVYSVQVGAQPAVDMLHQEFHLVPATSRLRFIFDRQLIPLAKEFRAFEKELLTTVKDDPTEPLRLILDQPRRSMVNMSRSSICFHAVSPEALLSPKTTLDRLSKIGGLFSVYHKFGVVDIVASCEEPALVEDPGAMAVSSPLSLFVISVLAFSCLFFFLVFVYFCFVRRYRDYLRAKEKAFKGPPQTVPSTPTFVLTPPLAHPPLGYWELFLALSESKCESGRDPRIMGAYWPLCLLAVASSSSLLNCPTVGTSAYIFVTITDDVDVSGFIGLLSFYSKLMPRNETIEYHFYFGNQETDTVTTANIQEEVDGWIDDTDYINKIYNASLDHASEYMIQYDDPKAPLSAVTDTIFTLISQQNQQPLTVVLKKQVVLLTNYVPINVTNTMNNDPNVNLQRFGLFHGLNKDYLQEYSVFPVYSVDDERLIPQLRTEFQESISFQFPPVHETKPLADNFIFLTSPNPSALLKIVTSTFTGDMCMLQQTRMYSHFISVMMATNETVEEVFLPWLGTETKKFLTTCIKGLPVMAESDCDESVQTVVTAFAEAAARTDSTNNETFITFVSHDDDCVKPLLSKSASSLINTTSIRIVSASWLKDAYEPLGIPLIDNGFLVSDRDHQFVENTAFYLTNYSTVCVSTMPFVPLTSAYPYRRPKHLRIALDDMLWITICASICCMTTGCILYNYVKRNIKRQQELLNEIMLQPREAPRGSMMVTKLPWEIKPEKVHIDKEFLLGEGTVSNVYLGKLKGKAPIMQWIDKVEMKQYQDCAVAVRVPKHFDEPEEDQLSREIQSMRRLKHHDHVALLLGWTNKDGLVCSLLELTHMNLIKYLGQIKDTLMTSPEGMMSTKYIPYQMLYKVIWEICDGMAYIHSRNLVHRDLTARNVLLTTGLRAKISGFGFCSEVDDPKFAPNSVALRFLPVRWMSPESYQGKFSPKSDVWSFAIMLYEIFTLGEVPYEDLRRPEDIVEAVRKGRIPQLPQYASKETYNTMKSCLQQFPERRPHFGQLLEAFMQQTEGFYNSAFEDD